MSRLRLGALSCLLAAGSLGSGAPARASTAAAPEPRLTAGRAGGPAAVAASGRRVPPREGAGAERSETLSPWGASLLGRAASARLRWSFRSASPVTGPPGVSAAGLVYVASVEGFVHALGADGSFRWSYGLPGIPLGAPVVAAGGHVYVATSEGRLYALDADGQLAGVSSLGRFASAPLWADGWVYVAGRDRNLYGVSGPGGSPSRSDLGEPTGVELASLGGGLVALGTARGAALVDRRAASVARLELGGPLVQPLLAGGERWFAVTADGITALDAATRAVLWSAPARRAALSADRRSLVVEADRELRWLSPATGEVLGRASLPDDVSAAPALTNAGIALVPLVGGELWVVDPLASSAVRIGVGRSPPWAPVYDESSGSVTVAAGGSVSAIALGSAEEGPSASPSAGVAGGGT